MRTLKAATRTPNRTTASARKSGADRSTSGSAATQPRTSSQRRTTSSGRGSSARATSQRRRRFEAILPDFALKSLAASRARSRSGERTARKPRNWGISLPRIELPLSWLLVVILLGVIGYGVYWTQSDTRWFVYRENVVFENTGYLNQDELYELSGVDSWNVFWLRSEAIRQRLLTHPFVLDAQVGVELPNEVRIRISPAEPVAIWNTGFGKFWLMPSGYARPLEKDAVPMLPTITDLMMNAAAGGVEKGTQIQKGVLFTSLQLMQRIPDLTLVTYNQETGINFSLPGKSLYVYWGDERNFDEKMLNLDAALKMLDNGSAYGTNIDVRTPGRPFVKP